jgi:serine phosphatase RsbU (regulator of sigma subunit)
MIDSINYAKLIQNTLLASKSTLETNLKDYFILFKPKDIVSGDFYWATKKDDCFYLACCDSTGHGVPGAFMSLLNIGFITEAIKEKNILEPGNIFNYVRQRLIETIGNEGQKDGFDGILIKNKCNN